MWRSPLSRAPVFIMLVDKTREDTMRAGCQLARIKVELGDGVTSCTIKQMRTRIDEALFDSAKYGSCKTGAVYSAYWKRLQLDETAHAYSKYNVVGSMNGGFVKRHAKYGNLLTGNSGCHARPGVPARPGDKNF